MEQYGLLVAMVRWIKWLAEGKMEALLCFYVGLGLLDKFSG